jgi:predicted DNA-binding protein with PD1-like motif
LQSSRFKAIGALSYAKLGWFNWETKKYEPACFLDEQVELLSVIGDIALNESDFQAKVEAEFNKILGSANC